MDCSCSDKPCAAGISVFQHLDHESLAEISRIAVHRQMRRGEILFSPDDCSGLYLIREGRVKVYELSPTGKEYLLRVLYEGDFVGEEALFLSDRSYSFGEALTDGRICFIRRNDFLDLLKRYPTISIKLLEELSRRLSSSAHQAAEMNENVMSRLASYILKLSEAQGTDAVSMPMSVKELSSYLNTTPETLSRRLSELGKQGLIVRKGRNIMIAEKEALADI